MCVVILFFNIVGYIWIEFENVLMNKNINSNNYTYLA